MDGWSTSFHLDGLFSGAILVSGSVPTSGFCKISEVAVSTKGLLEK